MYSLLDELKYITIETCRFLGIKRKDKADTQLMLGTAATETGLGKKLRQIGFSMESNDGAFGSWQMELKTDADIWTHVLAYNSEMEARVLQLMVTRSHKDNLIGNIWYACAMARLQYWRFSEPLPEQDDIYGQAHYWLDYYNKGGKGTVEKFVSAVRKHVLK
jgi:hypothetical protein